ncbi:MAG: helix-turn-helix domain-containing protein [Flavobacteriaceae bacterium]|jgi:hypothetical protein|nr:helix-turn-helix domain-containing protein [Flavobacteriaceae bacterium]
MNKVKAFIEIGKDRTYSVYIDLADNTLNYGIHGNGNTVDEAIEDFKNSYSEMKEIYAEMNKKFVEAEFEYHYDTASFLEYYTAYFSLTGLSRLVGIHHGQLSHYVTGRRTPSKKTVEKMQYSIQKFGKELNQVHFI